MAVLAAVVEMNCRREMRFFTVPPVERPARAKLFFVIEYARS
jgi:hypothetical protein